MQRDESAQNTARIVSLLHLRVKTRVYRELGNHAPEAQCNLGRFEVIVVEIVIILLEEDQGETAVTLRIGVVGPERKCHYARPARASWGSSIPEDKNMLSEADLSSFRFKSTLTPRLKLQ